METKVLAIAAVAIIVVAGAGAFFLFSGNENDGADIVIACGSKNCYEPFWIADDKDLFDKHGIKVKMSMVDGGGNAMTALLSGNADLTLVGADPAIRMFEGTQGGYAIATIETAKTNTTASDFAYNESIGIDLDDASTFFNTDGSIKVYCGLDTTTGYFSGYISYLYHQYEIGKITEDQYKLLKTKKTTEKDGGIIHVDFDKQVAALTVSKDIQMICSGNTVSQAAAVDGFAEGRSSWQSVVGGCVIVASQDAYDNKKDALVKCLRALDEACALIENKETVDDISKFCAKYYGAEGWTAEKQKNFFSTYYWDICTMTSMAKYFEYKAKLIDDNYAKNGYSKLIKEDLVVEAHKTIELYDGKYIYDSEQGKLIDNP